MSSGQLEPSWLSMTAGKWQKVAQRALLPAASVSLKAKGGLKDCPSEGSQTVSKTGQSLPYRSPRWQLCWPSLFLWELRIFDHKMSTKQSLSNHKSSGALSSAGSLTSCIRKLSSTHSRKLLHFSSLLNCISCRHLASWSPPWEQGLMIMRLLTASCQIFHLPLPPAVWVVPPHPVMTTKSSFSSCMVVSSSSCLLPMCIRAGGFQVGCWSQHPSECLIPLIPVWSFSALPQFLASTALVSLLCHRSPAPLRQQTKGPHQKPSLKYWCGGPRLILSEFGFTPFPLQILLRLFHSPW